MEKSKIYLFNGGFKMHTSIQLMTEYPPEGYEFIIQKIEKSNFLSKIKQSKFVQWAYKELIKPLTGSLAFNHLNYAPQIPEEADLVFSNQILNINKPYVLDIIDQPSCMVGYDYDFFTNHIKGIEAKLLSKYCKKIIISNETSMKIMHKTFSKKVLKKTVLVHAAIRDPVFKKNYNKNEIQLLFMGSIANPQDFYPKGGLEALESFKRISEDFPNIKLIVRCKLPDIVRDKYKSTKNLTILEYQLSKEEWQKIIKDTDICLNLGHHYPLMANLEAMSYGIPIIALDTWAVRDYLDDSCAVIIKPSEKIKAYSKPEYPLNLRSNNFFKEVWNFDDRVISEISSAIIKLANNNLLREKMGQAGKERIKNDFSIEEKRKKLKIIFDKALTSD